MKDFQNEDLDLIFANKKGKSLMLVKWPKPFRTFKRAV